MKFKFFMLLIVLTGSSACKKAKSKKAINELKINEVQTVGSHNSYRNRTYQPVFDFVLGITNFLPQGYDPNEWDYDHILMEEQFSDYGIRSIELDIYHDPQGGRYYHRQGLAFIGENTASNIPELQEVGFKVIHIPDVDYETNYYTFKSALQSVKDWSDANPKHLPIHIMVELKTQTVGDEVPQLGFVTALPIGKNALDSLDQEIRDIFGDDLEKVITPDEVRGDYATIREAVLANNWPKIGDARGKVTFVLMANNDHKAAYLDGHPMLEGRPCFFFANESDDEAAFIKYDNPVGNEGVIQDLVRQGFIIRTRADAGTEEGRTGDYTRQDAAFNSGAQLISTDYYMPDYRHDTSTVWTDYTASVPSGDVAQLNMVNAADKQEGVENALFED